MVIVAHSMGGLVARAAINQLSQHGAPPYLEMYISISTPYGGHDAARLAVEHASEPLPSWIDVAPGSTFLTDLHGQALPATVPFYLFFGFAAPRTVHSGPNGDGTVTLHSQLDPRAQRAATRVFGFDATHDGILTSPAVRNELNALIANSAP